jgi:transcriptional regulator with XRE-family HTH domain
VVERIGDTVRAVRERAGGSLEDLAARSGVPISVLAALERGERGITTTQLDETWLLRSRWISSRC